MADRKVERRLVAVSQPYVPDYRVPFFDELARQVAAEGFELEVWHGRPDAEMRKVGSARTGPWSVEVPQLQLRVFGRTLALRRVWRRARGARAVVAPFSATALDAIILLFLSRTKTFLWGHGRSYVNKENHLGKAIKTAMARRAQGVFVYTPSAVAAVESMGVPRKRICPVFNATDTATLRRMRANFSSADVEEFRHAQEIPRGPVGLFVGAFIEAKRMDFLFRAIDRIVADVPDFTAVIAGSGPLQEFVSSEAHRRRNVRVVPRLDQEQLVRFSSVSDILLMPGRVGLVAVDAVALGLPIITTDWPFHAPEAEYLNSSNSIRSGDSEVEYANAVIKLVNDKDRLLEFRARTWESGALYSVEAMAANFITHLKEQGVLPSTLRPSDAK
ncbi:glycosyltransferase family 4 protein [Curtobacterium citreum]|jgi:glycosyltransferase involved in cell wall biosynthesis|uniref:glycosyltransferase family 4 protein n=1 Tax=Curtobacterium citreum TaxID=2036 RepID=UPI00217D156B|nr:glycosyltransferase family 4 protein [Curtobacterium flaccumfaciens]MCS6581637.1 glycosyltransferase family 4 protein [Curtobacterium flaccumfaciens pv. beticola]